MEKERSLCVDMKRHRPLGFTRRACRARLGGVGRERRIEGVAVGMVEMREAVEAKDARRWAVAASRSSIVGCGMAGAGMDARCEIGGAGQLSDLVYQVLRMSIIGLRGESASGRAGPSVTCLPLPTPTTPPSRTRRSTNGVRSTRPPLPKESRRDGRLTLGLGGEV